MAKAWINLLGVLGVVVAVVGCDQERSGTAPATAPARAITFAADVAPIVYAHCVECHRPGGAGPFNLVTYEDVSRNVKRIVRAVETRAMPPWLPERGYGEFVGERHLDDAAIDVIKRWAEAGVPAGDLAAAPKPPAFVAEGEWALGTPDLVVRLPAAYTLGAEGPDLYRNFVFPTNLDGRRYVRAVELRSGNARVVHHANLFLDRTGASRRRSDKAGGLGYDAMDPGDDVVRPEGSDLNWRPGRSGLIVGEESSWTLPAGADIVLQTHLRRQGKAESLRPEVGLYFTDKPPTSLVARLTLRAGAIEIPAGAADHVVEAKYTLPVDAEALGTFAHAHYLGKSVHGWAVLPDGSRVELLLIRRWNFNMQDSYAYRRPIRLPRWTTVHMRWTFDNSAGNAVNPSSPPKRVFAGESSDDEMAEFWLQLRMGSRADYEKFGADYAENFARRDALAGLRQRLTRFPNDAEAYVELARLLWVGGRAEDGEAALAAALKLDAGSAAGNYLAAQVALGRGEHAGAVGSLQRSLKADPDNFRVRGDLALTLAIVGKSEEAMAEFGRAIALNPRDPLTRVNYARVLANGGKREAAVAEVREALRLEPGHEMARSVMREIEGR